MTVLPPAEPILPAFRTKIVRPRLPSDHVVRARLIRLLDRGLARRLTTVVAPAGFGKTTLLSAWNPDGYDVAWVSLDEGDGDRRVFMQALVGAVQAVTPDVGTSVLSLLRLAELPPSHTLAALLTDDLAELPDGIVIVLDDYHAVRGDEIGELMTRLLLRLSDNVHLVVASRVDPALPLSTLRARGELNEIRPEELAFRDDEALAFLDHALPAPLPAGDVAHLVERVEGWPAGLRLAALTIADAGEEARIAGEREARGMRYAREFIIDDVLAAQPPALQELLLRASVLERFCAPLLDALVADTDTPGRGAEWLAALKRANLFVVALDAEGDWCRFHHLFRDALRTQLRARHDDAFAAHLHQRTSDWFADRGLIREAIVHALAAGNAEQAARLLEESLHPLLDAEGDPGRLEEWLNLLPPEFTDRRPAVLLARGWLLVLRNRVGELPALLRSVELLLQEDASPDAAGREALLGTVHLLWSYVWGAVPDADRVLESTEAALARIPRRWRAARGHAENLRALGLGLVGREPEARSWLEERQASVTHEDGARLGLLLRGEARLHLLYLRNAALARTAHELLLLGQQHELRHTTTWGSFNAGFASYAWNDLHKARQYFSAATENRMHSGLTVALDCVFGLALSYQGLGEDEDAESILLDMGTLLTEIGSEGPFRLLRSCQARLALARDDVDEAGRLLGLVEHADAQTFPSFVEIPEITRARWLLLQGTQPSLQEVATIVKHLHHQASIRRHPLALARAQAVEALLLQTRGDTAGAMAVLQDVIAATKTGDILRYFVDFGSPMQRLLVELERWTVPPSPYLTRILTAFPAATGPVDTVAPSRRQSRVTPVDALTSRELEVLQLMNGRLSNKEIGRTLQIAPETVKKHASSIFQKLQVDSRRQAVTRAHSLGLLRLVPTSAP